MKTNVRDYSQKGFSGYTSINKAIVVSVDDPTDSGRIKVRIPGYHGNKSATPDDKLPWAQVCITKLPSNKNGGILSGLLNAIFNNGGSTYDLSLSPSVGDVVWVTFEGGDIQNPVVMGVLEYTARKSLELAKSGSSSGGGVLSIEEGTPAWMMMQIMMKYESNYDYGAYVSPADDALNGGSAGAITIGAIQNMGPRAKSQMEYLRTQNQAEFDKLASPSGLLDDVIGGDDWSSYSPAKSSAKGQAIISILTTEWGIEGQKTKGAADVAEEMNQAHDNYGVNDIPAQMFISNVIHQYGLGGANNQYLGTSPQSLESAYEIAINYSTQFERRLTGMFNDIKELRDSGKLSNNNNSSGTNLNNESKLIKSSFKRVSKNGDHDPYIIISKFKTKFMFPLINVNISITKYFENTYNPISKRRIIHDGIDIYNPNILGEKVYAIFDGTVKYKTDLNPYNGCGNQISIIYANNNNLEVEYRHLGNRFVRDGEFIKAGTIIGTVGNTGAVSTSLLHLSIKINGGYQNPLTYLRNYNELEDIIKK